ncbi:MAG: SM-20-related protein [Rickettsiales bacterium]|jgi:SM-20-related protein
MLDIDQIADNLAIKGFSFIQNIFEEKLLESLQREVRIINQNKDFKEAGVGRLEDHVLAKETRKDKIKWLEGVTFAQKSLFEKLENIRYELNKSLMLGLFDVEAHFAIYKKGDFYKRHSDSFKGEKNRLISMVIYLNKDWQEGDGGILNIYENKESKNPKFSVIPKWGNAILFLSEETPHEVLVSQKTRFSIAIWFRAKPFI